MISEDLQTIIDEFNSLDKMLFIEATSEDKISIFEKDNNIKFPSKYKEWLTYSDGGDLFLPAGLQLYGIEHKPLINVNSNLRPNGKYLVIGALASGDPILCESDSEKISIYNIEANTIEADEVYQDFISFLKDLCNILGIGD